MRIAYLTGEYPKVSHTFIQREVAALREKGIDVYSFSVRKPGDQNIVGADQKAERENTFYILPPNPIDLVRSHLTLLLCSPGRYLQALKLAWITRQPGLKGHLYQLFYFAEAGIVAQQINAKQIQHLHNHFADSSCSVSMFAAELGGFTFSFTMHGPAIFFEPYRWRIDEKIKRALFVSCISYYCRSQGMLFAPINTWKRMHIIHCGVDPTLFKLVSHNKPGKQLLYVGRLVTPKGLPILLESLAILKLSHPDIVLTVVGDGPDRPEIEHLTTQLGLNETVKFVGYQPQTEVRDYIQQTDILVMSSFAEGVPVVLMEAMAAGVPVVATQIAGIAELVEEGVNGYLVPPSDAVSLADRIKRLLMDSQLRTRLGLAGREKVEKDFNIHHETTRLYRVIIAALQGKVESIRLQLDESETSEGSSQFSTRQSDSIDLLQDCRDIKRTGTHPGAK